MYTVGENGVGLLKMDFLGLRNLTILTQALAYIKKTQGKTIELSTIPIDDKKTYAMLSSAETTGIFQLESAGMRRYIKELKPSNIFDLMAMVALYRPGPIQTIPEFIKRKHDPKSITYPDPRLKDVLSQSYGIIAYQDDVLLTAITLAGYSWGDADKLRKAVGKKIPSEMKKQREHFIQGCQDNGLSKTKAEEIFNLIEPFAGYGFNKAHAACYAMIAYQTAYLKANYPVEYMTAVLTAESRANTGPARDEKITAIVAECTRMKIGLLPPDINTSDVEFSIEGPRIRLGLSAVKNVGGAAIEAILEGRTGGPFNSISDFTRRVDVSKVNRKTFESLIRAGAMDTFGKRSALLAAIPLVLADAHKNKKVIDTGQSGLFDTQESETKALDVELPDIPELTRNEILFSEKELLGFYLTEHPLSQYGTIIASFATTPVADITTERIGDRVTVIGMITDIKKIITKAGNHEMAFLKVEDLTGSIEMVVFPKIYAKAVPLLTPDHVIRVSGKVDAKDTRLTILVDDIADVILK